MAHKVRHILWLFALFLFCGCASRPSGESPAAPFVRQGYKCLEEGNYAEAVKLFRKGVGFDPMFAQAYRGLGLAYMHTGDLYRAEIFMRKALQIDSHLSDLWGYLGEIYLSRGDVERAVDFFERCPPEDPHYAQLHFTLGRMRLEAGDTAGADEEFDKALTHPDFWGGYWGKGMLAQLSGRWNDALNWYREAHRRAQKPEVLLGLADAYFALDHDAPAFFYYTLFLGTNPDGDDHVRVRERLAELEARLSIEADSAQHRLEFSVPQNCDVLAGVCAKDGKIVKELFRGTLTKGNYSLDWDGSDQNGKKVESGEYIGFIVVGDRLKLRKFVVP